MATVDVRNTNTRQRDIERLVSKVQFELDNRDYLKFTFHIAEILTMEESKDSTFEKEMVSLTIDKCSSVTKRKPCRKASALSLPELET